MIILSQLLPHPPKVNIPYHKFRATSLFTPLPPNSIMPLLRRPSLRVVLQRHHKTADNDDASVSSNASLHSTITVDRANSKDTVPSGKGRRSVRFNEKANIYHENTSWNKEDCPDTWYSYADQRLAKARMVQLAREIHKSEKVNTAPHSYQRVLLNAYDACCRAACHGESYDSDDLLSKEEFARLTKWTAVGFSRLGLERVCIREIARDRSNRRAHIVDAVLDAQDSLQSRYDTDELLRKVSQTISRPSRFFAAQVAKAQAVHL